MWTQSRKLCRDPHGYKKNEYQVNQTLDFKALMRYVVQGVPLLPESSRVTISDLCLGFCMCGVSHDFHMLLWASFGFSDFLLPRRDMQVGGLTIAQQV